MEEKIYLNTQVETNIDAQLRLIAAQKKVSRSEIIRLAIGEYLQQYQVVSTAVLPHPEGAQEVPLVFVKELHP